MFTNGANNSFEASLLEEQEIIVPDENRKWKFHVIVKYVVSQ